MQEVLGYFQEWLENSEESLENFSNKKEMREQLKLKNFITEEKKTLEIIPTLLGELQPRKLEDVLPDFNIKTDTYIIYPTGGYHPFYGIPNTFPIYQQKIWPFIRRIKFHSKWKTEQSRNNSRTMPLRENNTSEQLNPSWDGNYYIVNLKINDRARFNNYTQINRNGKHQIVTKDKSITKMIHRLVGLAFIPNPKKYKLVLHNNDDPTNYLPENLKWGTQSHNMKGKIRRRPDTLEQKHLALVDRGIIKG